MAEWGGSSGQQPGLASRTRNGGRRRHWKLPDMIQGVRHRFRDKSDKRRSKSPDYSLDTDTGSQHSAYFTPNTGTGKTTLTRAASMLSTDCGFTEDWRHVAAGNGNLRGHYNRVPNTRPQTYLDNGTLSDCDVINNSSNVSNLSSSTSSSRVARAVSVNNVNQSQDPSHRNSIPRAKSVRFGENRISVFLQDSTQALEECVRLALSYAEESKRGDYCSDTEAVTLARSLNQSQGVNIQSFDNKPTTNFWSDSEDRGRSSKFDFPAHKDPPTPTSYKPRPFGQAVNSLDRVERLDKFQQDKSRKKRSAQINEIFSFIDKILSGCDSGCNDEFCPFARDNGRNSARLPNNHTSSPSSQWTTQHKTYRFNSSSVSSEYQSKTFSSSQFPGGHSSDSYAYPAEATHRETVLPDVSGDGHVAARGNFRSGTPLAGAGFVSDSDCDISESSTVVDRRRPPRSRLRKEGRGRGQDSSSTSKTSSLVKTQRTTEDVFAQIIICCESNQEKLGMPKYRHIHQKISPTVCDAIFLCKVTTDFQHHNTT